MVEVTPWRQIYYSALLKMLESQNYQGDVELDTIPAIGYLAFVNEAPVAAGFLRRVEGGYAQIDGLTSNAELPGDVRNDGISRVVDALIKAAKDLKLRGIISYTTNNSIRLRADALGFRTIASASVITLPLSETH